MRRADLATAAALIALGGIVLTDALRLGIGWGTDGPKSGFFPFWLALLMILTSAVILVQVARRSTPRPFVTPAQRRLVLTVLWPVAAFVVLTQFIGLYVAAALYIAFYMRWLGRYRWTAVTALGLGIPVVTFLIFERWFLVPMPKGPLEAWLGF